MNQASLSRFMRPHLHAAFFVFYLLSWPSAAQVRIFNTYADVLGDTPQMLEGYKLTGLSGPNTNVRLTFTGTGLPDKEIRCSEIWGFGLDSTLYRVIPNSGMPARVVTIGRPCFYENGGAHLTMFIKETEEERKRGKFAGFLSDDLNSDMSGVSLTGVAGQGGAGKGSTREFLESRPEYADIIRCLGDNWGYVYVRECVKLHLKNGIAPAPRKEAFDRPVAVSGEGIAGTWSMTKNGSRKCVACELFEFRADQTYSWRNAAFSDQGRWRLDEHGDLVLFERVRDSSTPVEDAAPLKMKVKGTSLTLSSGDGTVHKSYDRTR